MIQDRVFAVELPVAETQASMILARFPVRYVVISIFSMALHSAAPHLKKEHADAAPPLFAVFYDFLMAIFSLDFVPEPVDLNSHLWWVLGDIVKRNDTAGLYERRVHLEILLDSIVSMISINKEKIYRCTPKSARNTIRCSGTVGIRSQEMKSLPCFFHAP
jgi:hypothetical protein